MSEKIRCTWDGCWRTSSLPYADGWAYLTLWGPAFKDGFYCKPHADAIEKPSTWKAVLKTAGRRDERPRNHRHV
jgi:hypothetical protein